MDDLLKRHARYRRKVLARERDFLRELAAEGQSPSAMYIGCSDSRVVPELLTNSSPGDIFVIRNVANLVPTFAHADASVGAALEYAVGHLKVGHLIVCGHYGCGGIKGVLDADPHLAHLPSLYEWLQPVGPIVAGCRCEEPGERWREAVQRNVVAQMENLCTYPLVREAWEADRLEIHGWIYDMFTFDLEVYDESIRSFVAASALLD